MKSEETILVQAFRSDEINGSPQYIHIYKNEEERKNGFDTFEVRGEYDHSFLNIEDDLIRTSWKNKAGSIQFCGSGAYAVAWMMLKKYHKEGITIQAENIQLEAKLTDDRLFLKIPTNMPERVSIHEKYNVFSYLNSGVFLAQLNDIETLRKENWKSFVDKLQIKEIHGLCLFFWDDKKEEGALRYFTPWHGREEDHVTGSIHQYLTPLVFNLYGAKKQSWTQLSKRGGNLITNYHNGEVFLSGNCLIEENNFEQKY